MPESSGNNRRDYSKFDSMSTEMLEDILRADSQLPDGENSDTDAILYIMEVIAKREKENTTGKFTDVDDAWASFSKNYLPCIKDDKSLYDFEDTEKTGIKQTPFIQPSRPLKNRRLMRVASIAVAISVLLLAGTVTASALGFDLWSAIAEWTKDTFGFSNAATNTQITQEPSADSQYKSLQDALDNYDISEKIAPTWFPEGYSLEKIDVNETPAQTTIHAKYSNKNKEEISFNITLLSKPSSRTYEKDGSNVTVYSTNKVEYYIMTNMDQTTIAWRVNNYECSILGSFTLQEAEKIIDSIYERNLT
ncbi:MAG: DUF4367 domain-containing protein [Oscillospiraceae bacterium]|nr:DUF4367 domain-containing protein [Oscillospiraceae bacterium]